jgi:hypothetical protein
MSLIESEDDEGPSWAILRIQKVVFIYEATERIGCPFQPPAFDAIHKLEKTVILTKMGKDRKFTLSANLITSS